MRAKGLILTVGISKASSWATWAVANKGRHSVGAASAQQTVKARKPGCEKRGIIM
jgi:hypothetical protein